MTEYRHITIAEADAGARLDRWFKRYYPAVTHGALEKALRRGLIRLDGKKAEPSTRVEEGQELRFPVFLIEEAVVQAKAEPQARKVPEKVLRQLKESILYQDANLLIINKPAGLPVQGGSGLAYSLDDALPVLQFDAPVPPRLIHRLDRDTSGVLVLARSVKAAAKLAELFKYKEMEKTYWALVAGVPSANSGVIRAALRKQASGGSSRMAAGDKAGYEKVRAFHDGDEDAKPATTHYTVRAKASSALAWLELKPLTGRTHQLRVHCVELGCPIVGDGKYGGAKVFLPQLGLSKQLHLHARKLVIPAECFGKAITATAPLPPHMQESWNILGFER